MPLGRRRLLRTCGAGLLTIGTGCAGLSGRPTERERTVNPMLDGTPTVTPTPERSSVGRTRTVDGTDVVHLGVERIADDREILERDVPYTRCLQSGQGIESRPRGANLRGTQSVRSK